MNCEEIFLVKTKLFLAALCIFMLPICFTNSSGTSSQLSASASGWVISQGYAPIPCECEFGLEGYDVDCRCDADTSAARTSEDNAVNDSGKAPVGLGSEGLILLAGLLLWLRFRA